MQAISQSVQRYKQLVSTDSKTTEDQLITIDKTKGMKFDNDHLFDQLSDLVNIQYKAWYCKLFYKLGKDRVLRLAAVARADAKSNPRGYFSKLLKTEAANI